MEATIFSKVVLPISLILIMLGMGISLTVDDFKRVLRTPKATLIGLVNQIILLPLVGFGICYVLDLSPVLAVGLMLLAACPGGVTSNLISHVSKGDLALSVSLTAVASFITVLTIPMITVFSLEYFDVTPPANGSATGEIMKQVFALTVVPILLGMFIRRRSPSFAKKLERPIRIASVIIFVMVVIVLIYEGRATILDSFLDIGLATGLLNIVTMLLGFLTARILRLNLPQSITITVESGIQNGTLAITIAQTILLMNDLSIPSAIYSLIMFATGGVMMMVFGRRKTDLPETAA